MRARSWCVAAAATAALVPAVHAQRTPEPPVFRSGADVVAVSVFVTDRGGRSVPGLTAADFEVEDAGKPVPILAFEAVDAGAASALGASPAPPSVRAAARRQFLILVDLSFSTAAGVRRAQQAARDFVATGVGPNDLVALATFGSAGVKVQVGFTPDRRQLEAAISGFDAPDQQRVRDPLSLAYDLGLPARNLQSGAQTADLTGRQAQLQEQLLGELVQIERTEQRAYRARVEGFVAGLEDLSRLLDSLQGRKQVVLLSGGFDQSVLAGVTGEQRVESAAAAAQGRVWDVDTDAHFGSVSASRVLDGLFRTMAATDTVLHTVDVTGLAAGGDVGAAVRGEASGGRDTLAQLAVNTGGRFVTSTNEVNAALREIVDASRYFYVLAFAPREPAGKKPRFRKLKVRAKRDGLQVSHRSGYVHGDDPADLLRTRRAQFRAAEVISKGLSGGEIGLRAVAVPYRSRGGELFLPVLLQVDGRALLERQDRKPVALEVFGYAFDAEGRIADVMALDSAIDAAAEPRVREKGLQLLTSFRVQPGRYDLRFLVRTKSTARSGALRHPVEVPAFDTSRLTLSAPLFTDDPASRPVQPVASRNNPQLEIPFRLGESPFTLEAAPVLRNDAAREVAVLAWNGSVGASGSALQVTATLLDAAGRRLPVEATAPRLVGDPDGFQRFVLRLQPKGVARGDYVLQLTFHDPASGVRETTSAAVAVE